MVTLPPEFIATKYPGYFWNVYDQKLYSVKVTGTLKPLVRQGPNQYTDGRIGWRISVKGTKRFLTLDSLKTLKPKDTVFPVHKD